MLRKLVDTSSTLETNSSGHPSSFVPKSMGCTTEKSRDMAAIASTMFHTLLSHPFPKVLFCLGAQPAALTTCKDTYIGRIHIQNGELKVGGSRIWKINASPVNDLGQQGD